MTTHPDSSQPNSSDDYGYDLAHEAKADRDDAALRVPAARDRERSAPARASERTRDSDGDLGYDDVHDR